MGEKPDLPEGFEWIEVPDETDDTEILPSLPAEREDAKPRHPSAGKKPEDDQGLQS